MQSAPNYSNANIYMQVQVDVNIDNANTTTTTRKSLHCELWSYLFNIHFDLTLNSTDVLQWIIIQNILKIIMTAAQYNLFYRTLMKENNFKSFLRQT